MKKLLALLFSIVILAVFTACEITETADVVAKDGDASARETTVEAPGDETMSETEESTTEAPETAPPIKTYPTGKYKVGTDIPAGEYFLKSTSTFGGYMCVSSDSNGSDILENAMFSTHHYVTVEDGQFLELSRASAAAVQDVAETFDAANLEEGMYRVGTDIPAGEYSLISASDFGGYVCIYDNSGVNRDIVSNNMFEANDYVTVTDGQYLIIERCTGSINQ